MNEREQPVRLEGISYNSSRFSRLEYVSLDECLNALQDDSTQWIQIRGKADPATIEKLGLHFGMHSLIREDILNTTHLPRMTESDGQLVLTLKYLTHSPENLLHPLHLSLLLGKGYVIVLQDFEEPIFGELLNRLQNGTSKARHQGADYLFYLLADAIVDSYYRVMNDFFSEMDNLEDMLLESPDRNHIHDIYQLKKSFGQLRSILYPVHEALLDLIQGDYTQIGDSSLAGLHDVCDHAGHILHMYESGRDNLSDMIELNNANLNNRINHSMKILAIITTLFIPLTLISGIYGMNFKWMPELSWKAGYPLTLALMALTAIFMYYVIRKNKLL